jgi:hypothetical protein
VGLNQQANICFSTERGMGIMNEVQLDFMHKRIILAVKRVEFASDRMLYKTIMGHWCGIFVVNIHAPEEHKIDDVMDSFYEKLEHVFYKFLKYHTSFCSEISLPKQVGKIFSNQKLDNGVVNFATPRNVTVN